mgnify:CR=1 FL=1
MITKEEKDECINLHNWTYDTDSYEYHIDRTLEWLRDSDYLNGEGRKFAKRFWDFVWHKGEHKDSMNEKHSEKE